MALPALGTLAAEPLYRLVDTAIVGRLGTTELAGVAIAVAVLSLVIAGSNFLAYGTTERVARRLGAGENTAAAGVGLQAMWLGVLVGTISVPLLIILAEPLAGILGADGEVLDVAVTYLRISAVGVPFVLIGLSAQGVQRGASDYTTPLVVLVAANILNVVLELWFVFGLDLGVAGAAWSTVIAQACAGTALAISAWPRLLGTDTRRPVWTEMRPLLSAGRHLLLRVGSMLAVFTGATAVAARIDEATLAAHQIANSMFFFLALSLDALAVPAQTLVAEELGRGARDRAREYTRRVVVLSLLVGAVVAAVLALAAPSIAQVFTDDPAVVDRATTALRILALIMLPGALAFAYDGVLIGAADYRFLGRVAFGYLLAVIPLAALVLAFPALGIAGIWGALTIWMILRAAVNHWRVWRVLAPAPS